MSNRKMSNQKNMFGKLVVVCASPCCKDNAVPGQDFCTDCAEGEKWHNLKQVREGLGLMDSRSTGTLPIDQQTIIMENRKKRKKKADLATVCSPEQLQQHLDYMNEGVGE